MGGLVGGGMDGSTGGWEGWVDGWMIESDIEKCGQRHPLLEAGVPICPFMVCFALNSSVAGLSEPQGDRALSGPIEAALSSLWALAHQEEPEILWSAWQAIPSGHSARSSSGDC